MSATETTHRDEYDRWLSGRRPSAYALRWGLGQTGQWALNTPLMKLADELMLKPHQRWLDIGCGLGSLMRFVDQRVGFDHAPVGLDFSRPMLQEAHRTSATHDPDFVQGTATTLPFVDGTFDLVTCGYVIKHLSDKELFTFLIEVRRVLTGGGLALLWEFAPTGSTTLDTWNRHVLAAGVSDPQLRATRTLMDTSAAAGFEMVRPARLRPFLLPPIPRASVFIGKAPDGWVGPTA